ncbi:PPC domain-containing protein [Methylobacterium iners]|uniref:RapA2 cadherin-like domain-containing protein n=1 Tax=Methylobacterium iners TaxID=418707 RepID=A0ABQ4S3T6_9HYPH|nr:PPC domain-containing protein [Methylobacterium iners]GJD96432.1 hypothetical protein OCOJLMKI_3653 [Methylobacterium iners]
MGRIFDDTLAFRPGYYGRGEEVSFLTHSFNVSRPGTARAVADDYRDALPDTTAPFGTLAPGGRVTGSIETAGDRDVFAITLAAGQTYTFGLNRAATAGLADPVLSLQNANGTTLASNDDFGGSRNSQITYTAATSGTFLPDGGGLPVGHGRLHAVGDGAEPDRADHPGGRLPRQPDGHHRAVRHPDGRCVDRRSDRGRG